MTQPLGPTGLVERNDVIDGVSVRVVSYKVGDRFGARVDNLDPGDVIGRGRGATREEAEAAAIDAAALKLSLSSARTLLAKSMQTLKGRK